MEKGPTSSNRETTSRGREIRATLFQPHDPDDRDDTVQKVLKRRGVTPTEMRRGVITITWGDHKLGAVRHVVVTDEGKLRVIPVDRGFGRSDMNPELNPDEMEALEAAVAHERRSNSSETEAVASKFAEALELPSEDN